MDKLPDPHGIVGKEVPAADGGNYGHRVVGWNDASYDYIVMPIRWSTGECIGAIHYIDGYKLTYRYDISRAREWFETT
jgi:hypothetical protein